MYQSPRTSYFSNFRGFGWGKNIFYGKEILVAGGVLALFVACVWHFGQKCNEGRPFAKILSHNDSAAPPN